MNMNIDPEWLKRNAEEEGNGIISVGGLTSRIAEHQNNEKLLDEVTELMNQHGPDASVVLDFIKLHESNAAFVELATLARKLKAALMKRKG